MPTNRGPSQFFDNLDDFRTGFVTKIGKSLLGQKHFTMEGKSVWHLFALKTESLYEAAIYA